MYMKHFSWILKKYLKKKLEVYVLFLKITVVFTIIFFKRHDLAPSVCV